MSRLTEVRSQLNQRGKSVVSYGADLLEWSAEKNLAVAGDIASFAVAQIRLSVEAQDFAEYRAELQESFSGFGETLKEQVVDPQISKSSRKTGAKKKAAAKKTATKIAA
jgi:hypothetical protein